MSYRTRIMVTCAVFVLLVALGNTNFASAKSDDFFLENLILAANLNLRSGNTIEAIRNFEKAENMEPKNPDVLIGLVRAYAQSGDFDKAQLKLDMFGKNYPYDMRGYLIRGEFLSLKGHTEEASKEFIKLVEMGIYRFEALQALVLIYAQTDSPAIKTIIDTSIPLYESKNQVVLYDLLAKSLADNNKPDEAYKYKLLSQSLTKSDEKALPSDEINPLEHAVIEAKGLMDMGAYKAAEEVLADATSKWPSDPRFQVMLKQCYMNMFDNVPVTQIEQPKPGGEFGSLLPSQKPDKKPISEMIPKDARFTIEVNAYLSQMVNISEETEAYFTQMLGNFTAMQSRIIQESSNVKGNKQEMQRNMQELQILLKESATVCDLQAKAIEQIIPPENFKAYHQYLLETSQLLTNTFTRINYVIQNQQWEEYFKMDKMLEDIKNRTDRLDGIFMEAIQKETATGSVVEKEPAVTKEPAAVTKPVEEQPGLVE
jgi:tetratricopeptide (TPR) repeat protein